MVYYKNGKVKGFTKKVALPLALAASAFTPVLADTTLKVVGPEGDKIAFDETKEVKLNMTSEGDNVSFVEVNIELPAGLQYVEGSFKKADIEALKAHQYKVTLTPKGFHVAIYSDNLASMGDMTDTTIGTFDVKANTKLTGEDNIAMTIVDLTDKDANQIDYNNAGTGNVEGAEGDNSLGSKPVTIDKSKFPGEWKVYTVAALNADGQLEFNPLFDPQSIQVALKNDIAQIAGLEFQLILPQGLKLKEATLLADANRKEGQNLSFQKLDFDGTDNDYKVFYLGGDKPFKLTDGALLSFDVEADLTLANDPAKDFTDEIVIQKIKLTDIYSVAVANEDLTITVFNPNEKAYVAQNAALDEVEEWAKAEPYTRVYDYSKVLAAREEANDKKDEYYQAGLLGYNGNEAEVAGLIADYKAEIEADTEANEKLYADGLQNAEDLQDELDAANKPQTVEEARAMEEAPEVIAAPEVVGGKVYTVDEFIDPALEVAYEKAKAAIQAYADKIQELYDEKTLEDPDRYDGALLTDSELDGGQVFTAEKAAQDAIDEFVATRDEINATNKQKFQDIVNGDLAQRLEEAKAYVEQLTADGKAVDNNGPYANYENLQEIKDAIAAAEEKIANILSDNGSIEVGASAIALPFEEGIQAVLDEINSVIDAIDDVIETADNAKAVNDLMNAELTDAFNAVDDALADAEDALEAIRADEKYKYIDSSEKTADLMKAIDEEIAAIKERVGEIKDDVNNKEGYDDQPAEVAKVAAYLEELADLLAQIEDETYLDENGDEQMGLDKEIENAVATYDKFHMRGDANMDGKVSMIDYNIILQVVREELDVAGVYNNSLKKEEGYEPTEEELNEMVSQLNVVQEKAFGTDIEINITDAVGALWIYLNEGTDEGLGLGDRYYSARAAEQESLTATSQLVNGVRRIALNLSNAQEFTAAQLDVMLPEGMTIVGAQLGELNNGHSLFVGNAKNGRQRVVISNSELKAFNGSEGAVLYIDVEGAGEVQFDNVIFSTTKAESVRFNVNSGSATGIAGATVANGNEQVFSLSGRVMNALKKGVNIIRRADGTTQKVIKK